MVTASNVVSLPTAKTTPKDIEDAIDASDRAQSALEQLDKQAQEANIELARSLVRDLASSGNVDPVVAKFKDAERKRNEQKDALEAFKTALDQLLVRYGQENPDAMKQILTKRNEELTKRVSQLNDEITSNQKRLQALPKKQDSNAPAGDPKST